MPLRIPHVSPASLGNGRRPQVLLASSAIPAKASEQGQLVCAHAASVQLANMVMALAQAAKYVRLVLVHRLEHLHQQAVDYARQALSQMEQALPANCVRAEDMRKK